MSTKSFAIETLGCKVNTYESDLMAESLKKAGFLEKAFSEKADIYIINTCTVTGLSDKKTRNLCRRARRLAPHALVAAVGCFVDDSLKKGEIEELIKEGVVDIAVQNSEKQTIVSAVRAALSERDGFVPEECAFSESFSLRGITKLSGHTRAFLKVQDGCGMSCSYCVIPFVRGKPSFRPAKEVLSEVEALASGGCAEFVLTGINLSSMGDRLVDLLEEASAVEGVARLRLGSLEPQFITKKRILRMSGIAKLCPHFHLSLQSGSDKILKAMNRHYTSDEYLSGISVLREYFGHPAITTDIITGFPGETERDFEETLSFAEKAGFYEVHVFKYSKRPGTPAAGMPDQVPEKEKAERSRRLIKLSEKLAESFREYYIGRKVSFLSEEMIAIAGESFETGYTPEYVRVALSSKTLHQNQILEGTVSKIVRMGSVHGGEVSILSAD